MTALAIARYPAAFARLLPSCGTWVNGEDSAADAPLCDGDEVAFIPPVSGG